MKGKVFFDTNILIYLLSDEKNKHEIAVNLYRSVEDKIISTQVINELVNVFFKKKLPWKTPSPRTRNPSARDRESNHNINLWDPSVKTT